MNDTHLWNVPEKQVKRDLLPIVETLEEGRAYSVSDLPSREEARRMWAGEGQGRTFVGRKHITNVRGRRAVTYLLDTEVPTVLRARAAVQELTGNPSPGWTHASLARTVTRWLDLPNWAAHRPLMIPVNTALPSWHYQECIPCDWRDAALYDMRSAYWQIALRAKSPVFDVFVDQRQIIWGCISGDQEERWQRMGRALEGHKQLRLAIIGVNSAGWRRPGQWVDQEYYFRGSPCTMRYPPGPLQPLAILTVVAARELTQIQAQESAALYANADCVVVDGGDEPKYWKDYGIAYRLVARGKTEIRAMGAYSIGTKETIPFALAKQHDVILGHKPVMSGWPGWHERLKGPGYAAFCD
jgi:hypothetical protein